MNRAELLAGAQKAVIERGGCYAPPLKNFRRIAALQAVISECSDPLARVALDNIAVKVARLIETPDHLDSWVDIAGYAACGAEVTTIQQVA